MLYLVPVSPGPRYTPTLISSQIFTLALADVLGAVGALVCGVTGHRLGRRDAGAWVELRDEECQSGRIGWGISWREDVLRQPLCVMGDERCGREAIAVVVAMESSDEI